MDKIIEWLRTYSDELSWWVIGWLSFAVIDCVVRENWEFAIINTVLAYFNYRLWKARRE
jgi:hypothetical protein